MIFRCTVGKAFRRCSSITASPVHEVLKRPTGQIFGEIFAEQADALVLRNITHGRDMLGNAARRLAVVVSLAAVALISAPFVSPSQRESERLPRTEPPKTQSRIGVTLRSGDTLLGVLKRFGVETPSAHALLEKVRPLMNVRKIQPGNDVHDAQRFYRAQ